MILSVIFELINFKFYKNYENFGILNYILFKLFIININKFDMKYSMLLHENL